MTVTTTKTCTGCGRTLTLGHFYAHPRGLYGRESRCKPCKRREVYANRDLKAEVYAARRREYEKRPERVAAKEAYRQTPAGRASVLAAQRRYNRWKRVILRDGSR